MITLVNLIAFALLLLSILLSSDPRFVRIIDVLFINPLDKGLRRVKRGHLWVFLGLVMLSPIILFIAKGAGINVILMAVPEFFTWMSAFEVAYWIDAVVTLFVIASVFRMKVMVIFVRAIVSRLSGR